MTKFSFQRSPQRIYSVLASGLGCASLLGIANVAIARQAVTATALDRGVTSQEPAQLPEALAVAPLETALVLPPEHFPIETAAQQRPSVTERAADTPHPSSGEAGASAKAVRLLSAEIDPSPAQSASSEGAAVTLPTAATVEPASDGANPASERFDAAPLSMEGMGVKSDSVDYGTQYIDPTDYSLGATEPVAAPDVVLTERSTGCKTVLRPGDDIPQQLCGAEGSSAPARSPAAASPGRISTPQVNAVRVGTITVDGTGIRLRRSVRDYYNKTARPQALRGNGDNTLMFPLAIPARISSPFGWRVHPIFGDHRLHTGTDFAVPQGTPVVAAFSGRVALSDILGGYGVTVVLQHDKQSTQTLYGHLSEVFVKSGEWVEQGTVIGRVGSTGNSTGPHLHFEYRQRTADGWIAVNAGQLLQQALGGVGDIRLADITLNSSIEISQLSIPKLLRGGKNATKALDESTLVARQTAALSIANASEPETAQ
ncbi:MAG: M23 family metallopeptidase [Cyanobacteria bacterium P01_A01_bin.135]